MTFERLLLTARVLQAEHEFSAAADALKQAVRLRSDSAEAWLMLSDTLRRGGFPVKARAACLQLGLTGEAELAKWCGIQVLHSLGELQRAYQLQQGFMDSINTLPIESRQWALSVAADSAAFAGVDDEAHALYSEALSLGRSTLALRLAFADFLLSSGRHGEVQDVLSSDHGNTAALMRIAIAGHRTDDSAKTQAAATVESSLQVAEATRDPLRFRDRAIWELRFRGDANAAHDLARANWATQKGYEDLALLRDAAEAAGRNDTLAMLDEWLVDVADGERS